jgi:hypothetical protein
MYSVLYIIYRGHVSYMYIIHIHTHINILLHDIYEKESVSLRFDISETNPLRILRNNYTEKFPSAGWGFSSLVGLTSQALA